MLTKTFKFKTTDLNEDGSFEGYLSVFGNEDLGGDVCKKGCFSRSVKATGGKVPVLAEHTDPIGIFESMKEDTVGLFVKGRLLIASAVPEADKTYALMKAGVVRGMSIGYEIVRDSWKNGVHYLDELKLWEGSIVLFPMNPEAQLSAVKSAGTPDGHHARLREVLGAFSKTMGEDSYLEQRRDIGEAICEQLYPGSDADVWVVDFGPDWAVFDVWCDDGDCSSLYSITYSIDNDTVLISDLVEVETNVTYVPVATQDGKALRRASDPGKAHSRTDGPADMSSSDLHLLKETAELLRAMKTNLKEI